MRPENATLSAPAARPARVSVPLVVNSVHGVPWGCFLDLATHEPPDFTPAVSSWIFRVTVAASDRVKLIVVPLGSGFGFFFFLGLGLAFAATAVGVEVTLNVECVRASPVSVGGVTSGGARPGGTGGVGTGGVLGGGG